MYDQCEEARSRGISAVCVSGPKSEMDSNDLEGLKTGLFSIVFLAPEILVKHNKFWNDIFLDSDIYRRHVCLIAVDEAHIIDTWGSEFRPAFSRIGEMRSFFHNVPFLLLSATCGDAMLTSISRKVHMSNDVVIETASPDRPNIYLSLKSEPGMNLMTELHWLVEHLRQHGEKATKTLLYVRNLTTLGKVYMDFMGSLGRYAYLNSSSANTSESRILTCFHSSLSDEDQKNIIQEFKKADSYIRLIICTVAFGLGVNVMDIGYIIHWGVCGSVLEYWQEVGRAGRDGRDASAYCYAYKASLNANVSDDMRKIVRSCKDGLCIRQAVLSSFVSSKDKSQNVPDDSKHGCVNCHCCSVCKLKCTTCRHD
ncbi:hypothetical protein FSP39_024765 [Pinctada imbricata]|uniref:DNA 3'-5' helicase n=1 Tax=Pinctada imbricata TaxID=66713 RepID=A0AA88YGB1_PINIB|nr:hypothetical protein FSP39_024765 [Pinctada imbricata]